MFGRIETKKRTRSKCEDGGPHSNHRGSFPRRRQEFIQLVQEPQSRGVVALDLVVCTTLRALEGLLNPRLVLLRTLYPMKQTGFWRCVGCISGS